MTEVVCKSWERGGQLSKQNWAMISQEAEEMLDGKINNKVHHKVRIWQGFGVPFRKMYN